MRTFLNIALFISATVLGGCSDSDSCPTPKGTFDIPTKASADGICASAGSSCKVCVQDVDANGNAVRWSAITNLTGDCSCPTPTIVQPDASTDAGDASAD